MSWCVSPWVYPAWEYLHLMDLINDFLFHIEEVFNYNLFKNFILPFLFLFFFWDPCNSNVVAFDIVMEVSKNILRSFHFLIYFFRRYSHHFNTPAGSEAAGYSPSGAAHIWVYSVVSPFTCCASFQTMLMLALSSAPS